MAKTFNQICDAVVATAGTEQTLTSYIGNTDLSALRIVTAVNQALDWILGHKSWAPTLVDHTITMVGATQKYTLPADAVRIRPDTLVNTTGGQIYSPISRATYNRILAGALSTSDYETSTVVLEGKSILFTDAVVNGETVICQYYSSHSVLDVDGVTTKPHFVAATDTSLIDESLLILVGAMVLKQNNDLTAGLDILAGRISDRIRYLGQSDHGVGTFSIFSKDVI
jgi:hypothetical protein